MKRLLLAGLLACVATGALADGGGPTNPLYVREQQGTTRTYAEVSCTTAGDIVLVAASSMSGARSVTFFNEHATNYVTICPTAGVATACDNVAEGFRVSALGSVPIDRSVRDTAWSCMGDTTTVIVGVLIEK